MKKYLLANGSTEEHVLAVGAEVCYLKDAHPRGYYLRVRPVEREKRRVPATKDRPEYVYWSEIFELFGPNKRVLLKEVGRKSDKAEAEAATKAQSVYLPFAEQIAEQKGWRLTGEETVA